MARLSRFRVDSTLLNEGEWVHPDEAEYDDLEIKTRGFTDAYTDSRAVKLRRAAQRYGNDVARVPAHISRDITIEALIQHCLLDVRNIVDDNGNPITFDAFCNLLRNPDYADLVVAALKAASIVGMQHDGDREDATKNSPKPSK
jgi:hypothetical protein